MGVGNQRHSPAVSPPGKNLGIQCTGGRLGPRAGVEIPAPTGIRAPDRPARSKSLYRLSYPCLKEQVITYKYIKSQFY